MERRWRTLKYEEVYMNDYENPQEAHHRLSIYIEKYNNQRLHSMIGYKTPGEIYGLGEMKYLPIISKLPFLNNDINYSQNVIILNNDINYSQNVIILKNG